MWRSTERILFHRVSSEICFQPIHPDTSAPVYEKRVTAARDKTEFASSIPACCRGLNEAREFRAACDYAPSQIKDADHDALWLALVQESGSFCTRAEQRVVV